MPDEDGGTRDDEATERMSVLLSLRKGLRREGEAFSFVLQSRWQSSFGCRANEAVPCVLLSDIVSIYSSKGPLNAMRSLCDLQARKRQFLTRAHLVYHHQPAS